MSESLAARIDEKEIMAFYKALFSARLRAKLVPGHTYKVYVKGREKPYILGCHAVDGENYFSGGGCDFNILSIVKIIHLNKPSGQWRWSDDTLRPSQCSLHKFHAPRSVSNLDRIESKRHFLPDRYSWGVYPEQYRELL